jgi:malate synthase
MERAEGVELRGAAPAGADEVLVPEALEFVAALHREFDARRRELLGRREERQTLFDRGDLPDIPAGSEARRGDWKVGPAPADLDDRRVEITGPAEAKMVINALNSGAKVFMADFEDALSPTWENVVSGQKALGDAVRRELSFTSPDGKEYRLNEELATLVVRPRGWHLPEKHLLVDGQEVSGSLFDFGLYFFHNARELLRRGSGPYFYLPKLEGAEEARLWNDVFLFAQEQLGIPRGTIRATVLIETCLAALEMEEILYELREHMAGLNAGRWDYIFSFIKKFRERQDFLLPDRGEVTMAVPFMRAYAQLLVKACHRRGAHAIGGMAAFIPSRRDEEVNRVAMARVREDKEREAGDGFDGTWVAHPDLVPLAREVFDRHLEGRPHQKHRQRDDVTFGAREILDVKIPGAKITEEGVRQNIGVGLRYVSAWLGGLGAVAINNLMEDAATAEISRAQLWQWIRHGARTEAGEEITGALYRRIRDEEVAAMREEGVWPRIDEAAELMDGLVLGTSFAPFLTLPGYERLD